MTQREKVAQEVRDVSDGAYLRGGRSNEHWLAVADYILAERAKREGPLIKELREAGVRLQYLGDVVAAPRVWDALRAHAALDAPPKRTPLEVAGDVAQCAQDGMVAEKRGCVGGADTIYALVPQRLVDELREALAEEDAK